VPAFIEVVGSIGLVIFGLWVLHICVKFLGGPREAGVGGVGVDVAGDGGQGCSEFGWGLGLVGCGEWDEHPVMDLDAVAGLW
jgi:hypothetical protein